MDTGLYANILWLEVSPGLLFSREPSMGPNYHCTNINCSFPGKGQFEMTFDTESIIDINNVATVFCPFCKKQMVTSDLLKGRKDAAADMDDTSLPS